MKKNQMILIGLILVVVIVFAVFVFLFLPNMLDNDDRGEVGNQPFGYSTDSVKAIVVEIIEEGEVQLGEVNQHYQVLQITILDGEFEGLTTKVDYGKMQLRPEGLNLKPGDKIIISVTRNINNQLIIQFQDFVRTQPLLILFGTFVLFSALISGWKGIRGILGMVISMAVIIYYIIPQILNGKDPVIISVSGAFFLLAVTLYLVYGWTYKTHAAVLGTLISLLLTAFLANYFVKLTRLTGFGSEDALFLLQQSGGNINMQGLVLGGMLIGSLGVLDDLVITQASVVFELFILDPELSLTNLYNRAMRVGQDHVAATVNTLVLAYAGAALPMFLLFSIAEAQLGYLLNLEFVAEEVVRTMVGSLGLVAAVPLTTILAALIVKNYVNFGPRRDLFGPLINRNDHQHSH